MRHTTLLVVLMLTSLSACTFMRKVDSVSKTPGLEDAQVTQELNKPPQPLGHEGRAPLDASPLVLDFGSASIASTSQKSVVISSRFDFPVTVVQMTTSGCGFTLTGRRGAPLTIVAHGQLTVMVSFRPTEQRHCAGELLIEIDSAGERFTRVQLKGRGI